MSHKTSGSRSGSWWKTPQDDKNFRTGQKCEQENKFSIQVNLFLSDVHLSSERLRPAGWLKALEMSPHLNNKSILRQKK